ncbi:MAG: hypothetical protein ACR2JB_13230 [Bryobacteraceae bacterium]
MDSGPINARYDLLLTAIDLTRACCANDNYLSWLLHHSDALHGSAGIANYLANAALAFEEQAHPRIRPDFDVFDARDNLADILMASAPLSSDELRGAVSTVIREARLDSSPSLPFSSPSYNDHFAAVSKLGERNGQSQYRNGVAG